MISMIFDTAIILIVSLERIIITKMQTDDSSTGNSAALVNRDVNIVEEYIK